MKDLQITYMTNNLIGDRLCLIDGKVYIEHKGMEGRYYSYLCEEGESYTFEPSNNFSGDPRLLQELIDKEEGLGCKCCYCLS